MKSLVSSRARAGFTLIELLVALALIVFIIAVISQAFVAGLESFRQLKAIGDMAEQLRNEGLLLRRHFDAAGIRATDFIRTSILTGKADRIQAAALRTEYEAIDARAKALDVELGLAEVLIDKPGELRIVRRVRTELARLKFLAETMVGLLRFIETGQPPGNDLPG